MSVEGKTRKRRGLKLALMVSLAVNLLVVGMVAGAYYRKGGEKHGARSHGPNSFGVPYVRALSKEDRRAVGDKIREGGWDRKSMREKQRGLYAQMITALRAEPFVESAVAEILSQQAASSQRALQVSQSALLAHVTAMQPSVRAAYVDRLEEVLSRTNKRRKER